MVLNSFKKSFKEGVNGMQIIFTQPGCTTQNRYIEGVNGIYRIAVLDVFLELSVKTKI